MIEGLRTRALTGADRDSIIAEMSAWTPGVNLDRLLPAEMFQPGSGISTVARDSDGSVAGFVIAMVSKVKPRCGYIHMVWVSPQFRGHGLATALYEEVFERLRERGCDRVEAATAAVNDHALQFHRKLGFCVGAPESVVDELGGQREAVQMWRDLGAPIRGWRAGFRSHLPASRQDHPHQR